LHEAWHQRHRRGEQTPVIGVYWGSDKILVEEGKLPGRGFRVVRQSQESSTPTGRTPFSDVPLRHWMRFLIMPIAEMDEAQVRMEGAWDWQEDLHEFFVKYVVRHPFGNLLLHISAMHAIGLGVEKGKPELIFPCAILEL